MGNVLWFLNYGDPKTYFVLIKKCILKLIKVEKVKEINLGSRKLIEKEYMYILADPPGFARGAFQHQKSILI